MKIRDTHVNNVFCEPGTFGYFGEKKSLILSMFADINLVSKIVTFNPYSQKEYKKTSNFLWNKNYVSEIGGGVVLSRDEISNPGFENLLNKNIWQRVKEPFFISITSCEETSEQRISEMKNFAEIFEERKTEFITTPGVVIVFDNPIDDDYESLVAEIIETLDIFSPRNMSVIVAVSLSFPPDFIEKVCQHKNCNAIFLRSHLVWDQIPKEAQKIFFRKKSSPFGVAGGGLIYGKYVRAFSLEWIRQAKQYCGGKPLIAGGGVLGSKNILGLVKLGVNGFVIDYATLLRPWNFMLMFRFWKKIDLRNK